MRSLTATFMVTSLIISTFLLAFEIHPVKAEGTVYIRADGSIDPSTAPIMTVDNITYTQTGNISSDADGIVIERDNIIVNGADHTVTGAGAVSSMGVKIYERSNITIENMRVEGFYIGLLLVRSSYCTLSGNNIIANVHNGIQFSYCSNNTVSGNTVAGNNKGFWLIWSPNNTVSGNTVTNNKDGVVLGDSDNNIVTDNYAANNGRGLYLYGSSDNNILVSNSLMANSVVGLALEYSSYNNCSGNAVVYNFHGIHLNYAFSNTLSDNSVMANNYSGFALQHSPQNTLSGNNVAANGQWGIRLSYSSITTVFGNDIVNNDVGITVHLSPDNLLYGNDIIANAECGIDFIYGGFSTIYENNIVGHPIGIKLAESQGNVFFHNNLVSNAKNVHFVTLYANSWDDGYPSGGNYWNDYGGTDGNGDGIGDTPYIIDALNVDNYPLMQSVGGFRWIWGDDDHDGILNYLDLGIFSFEESDAQSATAFGTVVTPIKITHLTPSSNYGQMMATLHEWGIKEAPIKRLMRVFVVDISNVQGILNWLRTHGLLSDDFYNKARSLLCADGHWRSLWVIRSDLDVFETCKAILELRKSMLHPDLWFDAITRIINLFDVEFYTLRGFDSVTSSLSFDFASISQRLASARKYVKELFISASTIIEMILTVIAEGGFAGIALQLGAKLINFILDYFIFDYVENDILDFIKIWMMAIDPPGDRVVLQLLDASGQTLLVGHNQTLDEDVYVFEHGVYSADNDSAILLLSKTSLDYNLTVTTTPTTVTPMPYIMIIWDCTENETIITGGILDPHQLVSTHLNLTNNELDTSYLSIAASLSNPNPQPGEQVEVSMNVTDDEGTPYGNCDVVLSIANEAISAQNQGSGFYNATIDTVGLAGFYNVTIFTRNPPPGFLQGMVTVPLEVGPHDIAVMNTILSRGILGLGYELEVNLTLQNNGFFAEVFNLTIYANATVIVDITNVALAGNDSMVFLQKIATSGWVYGNYSIRAHVIPVNGETDLTNNNSTQVHVFVSIPGDVDGDRDVDIFDIVRMAVNYSCSQPDPCYDPNSDIDGDGDIDIFDIVAACSHYGQSW